MFSTRAAMVNMKRQSRLLTSRLSYGTRTASSNVHQHLVHLGLASNWSPYLKYGGAALVAGSAIGQYYYGYQKDFYEYRFIVNKDPDDLAGFYGAEAFMELFCVVPFMGTLMMRGGTFDEEGTIHTTGFPAGDMQVSMVFSDDDDDEGRTKWFNKRERFKNVFMGYTMWDMVTNFGFERLDDGRCVVYHHGEYFSSRFPPFSLLVQLVFKIHARWVAWATDHHLNHYAFPQSEGVVEEWEEESRMDMPFFLLKNYAWSDLMGAVFGRKLKQPSFMLEQAKLSALEAEEDDEEEEVEEEEELFAPPPEMIDPIPVKRANIRRHITVDIDLDRKASLRRHTLRRTNSLVKEKDTTEEEKEPAMLQRHGSVAWQVLKSTNNPEAYKAVTEAARERQLARQLTRRATVRNIELESAIGNVLAAANESNSQPPSKSQEVEEAVVEEIPQILAVEAEAPTAYQALTQEARQRHITRRDTFQKEQLKQELEPIVLPLKEEHDVLVEESSAPTVAEEDSVTQVHAEELTLEQTSVQTEEKEVEEKEAVLPQKENLVAKAARDLTRHATSQKQKLEQSLEEMAQQGNESQAV